ncbi:MAG: hypothetical protein ABIL09_02740 [Gemmatimonadota bacterium]
MPLRRGHGVGWWALTATALLAALPGPALAQTARLVEAGTGSARARARPGDVLTVEVRADLGSVAASGVSVFISFPEALFQVVDALPAAAGIQPFVPGDLFAGGVQLANLALPPEEVLEPFRGLRLLDYAVVLGGGADRSRTGSGAIAAFQLRCLAEAPEVSLHIDVNPVRNSVLVLPGHAEEQPFVAALPLVVTVKGIDLLDIPDVVLLPGQIDDRQIGRLDRYVVDNRAPLDSLLWSFSGTGIDSLQVRIEAGTRRVTVSPRRGFTGRRQVTFAVSEPAGWAPGVPAPSASEVSVVTVNTPPRFAVSRDTVRLAEDQYTYIVSALQEPSPARAYRGRDLDLIVQDPEVAEASRHTAFRYGTLTFRARGDTAALVRGRVDSLSHQLLVWSRPDFAGVDSFRVIVADEFTAGAGAGQDSLRVIVLVREVPDAPRFIFAEDVIRLESGGSRRLALTDFVRDPDTPLARLDLRWTPDLGGSFTARREADTLVFAAPAGFVGQGALHLHRGRPRQPHRPAAGAPRCRQATGPGGAPPGSS